MCEFCFLIKYQTIITQLLESSSWVRVILDIEFKCSFSSRNTWLNKSLLSQMYTHETTNFLKSRNYLILLMKMFYRWREQSPRRLAMWVLTYCLNSWITCCNITVTHRNQNHKSNAIPTANMVNSTKQVNKVKPTVNRNATEPIPSPGFNSR